jgi:riboflavin kinase/FMN adenylyltransferase
MKPVTLSGTVTQFQGTGRRLGYPTANLRVNTDLNEGVYFGFADLADYTAHPALIFIGVPTTMGESERRVEVHVLNIPDVDYYDQDLHVRIMHFHRPNKHFDSVADLLEAMRTDAHEAVEWFAKNPLAKTDNVKDT